MAKKRSDEDLMKKFAVQSMDEFNFPICNDCVHLTDGKWTCVAYPKGIPDEITNNRVDHKEPYIGDNGIFFEKK